MIITVTLNPALDHTIWVENLVVGGLNRTERAQLDCGGKGINVSVVLAQLGIESRAMGFLAGDTGKIVLQGLPSKVMPSFTWLDAGSTRINTKLYHGATGDTTEFNALGPTPTPSDLTRLLADIERYVEECTYLVLAGSLPPQVPQDFYGKIIALAKSRGVKCVLDTSGPPLVAGVKELPWMIKPNRMEAEYLSNTKIERIEEAVEVVNLWLGIGIEFVVLTLGSDGVLFADNQHKVWARGAAPLIRSTVGCGDAMLAATLGYLQLGHSWMDTVHFATATATATVTTEGTSFRPLHEIALFLDLVTIEIL